MPKDFMDIGEALEIVHEMAKRALEKHGEIGPAKTRAKAEVALDTVEDLIVNEYGED